VIVSAIAVWIASAIAWMVLPHHKGDYRPLPSEDAMGEAMRKMRLAPGLYVIPHCGDRKQMNSPEMVKRYTDGPVAAITVLPNGPPAMGKSLVLYLGYCLLVSFSTAYVARHTMSYGTDGMLVLRMTSTVAFLAYGMSRVADAIWAGAPIGNTIRHVADSVAYGFLTGLTFMLLWPSA